jgi:hypothetical protein
MKEMRERSIPLRRTRRMTSEPAQDVSRPRTSIT